MMETLAAGLFCILPLALFGAGWASCYILMVKYRLRFERRAEYDDPTAARSTGRQSKKAEAWQP